MMARFYHPALGMITSGLICWFALYFNVFALVTDQHPRIGPILLCSGSGCMVPLLMSVWSWTKDIKTRLESMGQQIEGLTAELATLKSSRADAPQSMNIPAST